MGFMSQEKINVSLFDEVKRLQNENAQLEKRAEAAERERDASQRRLSALSYCIKNQVSSFYDARNYEEAVNSALVELNKFAIEQRISGIQRVLDCRELNLSEGDVATISLMQEQLRQQLNGGE